MRMMMYRRAWGGADPRLAKRRPKPMIRLCSPIPIHHHLWLLFLFLVVNANGDALERGSLL